MRLYERDQSLSDLRVLFAECRLGQQRTVVLTGAVGTGRTEVVRAFTQEAVVAGALHCAAAISSVDHALPFGTIWQLFMNPGLPARTRKQAAQLLDSEVIHTRLGADGSADGSLHQKLAYVSHVLSGLLLDVIEETGRPLLLTVDDAHHADPASLQCLLSITGRLRHSPLMAVVSAADGPQSFSPAFLGGLPAEPICRHLRLDLLTERGVESMLAEHLPGAVARRVAAECHALTGGNPVMVRGFADDHRRSDEDAGPLGPETVHAWTRILHRCDPGMLRLARWTAILGESGTPSVGGRLAGLDDEATSRTLRALDRTGCFAGGRFRHPSLRQAVLDGLAPAEQAAMHAGAAARFRIEGASVLVVADHLVAAGEPQDPWMVPTLNEAAEQALSQGRVNQALTYLRLACRIPAPGPHHEVSRALLARAEWRTDPALTMRHGAEVIAALRSGDDPGAPELLAWAGRLIWFGRVNDARTALERLGDRQQALDESQANLLEALRLGLSCLFPAGDGPGPTVGAPAGSRVGAATADPLGQALGLLVRSLTDGPGESTVAAEHLIEQSPLGERTFGALACALGALVYGGQLGTADRWCASLEGDAAAAEAPTWLAVLAALRSTIALRQGDPVSAGTHASRSLKLVAAEGWGVGVLLPLGVLIEATTMTGRYQEALTHLRTPVPDVLLKTPLAIPYLRACARFHAATGSLDRALREIGIVSELVTRWNLDQPALVPWRTDAALVHLELGRREEARRRAAEQWEMLGPAQARERGITLRVLAAAGEPADRLTRLEQSEGELRRAGDHFELSLTLTDLDRARQGGIGPRVRQIGYSAADRDGDELADAGTGECYQVLSKAELRVAALAADGHSNREIAGKLFVTVSTVEQHLTKVYSKLNVRCRSELPIRPHGLTAANELCA
ncbi:AAA family ATPase [Streptomyces sp. NPDC056883]|uniref:helix-turn-helix transcriptional regulator n=1 Tax=Streptomyces sp. NPDC056883 TaxID=3345959 RepID=UPI00369DB84B